MDEKILVTYATRAGSTRGVAEAIGETLAEGGVQVDVLPVQEVKDFSPYRAVVMGTAIQGGEPLPEAMQFMHTHRAALSRRPFAAFLVCMTMAMKGGEDRQEQYRRYAADWLAPVRSLVRPVSEGLFAGAFDLKKVPSAGDRLKFRLSILAGVWPEGDRRNWDAIHSWAKSVGPILLAR